MVTVEQIHEYFDRTIAEDRLAGNQVGLRHTEAAIGILRSAAGTGIEQVLATLEQTIQAATTSGDRATLRSLQSGAGALMRASEHAGDKHTAHRLRVLAAHAADAIEALTDS